VSFLLAIIVLVGLAPADVERLKQYNAAEAEGRPAALVEKARAEFAGRGPDIATHFLKHTDPQPRNDAYYFVLRVVGDADTALVLIRALPNPPPHESGMLDRDFGEIEVALGAVLENYAACRDPRVVPALEDAVASARAWRYGARMHVAIATVHLLGHCHNGNAIRALQKYAADSDAAIRTAAAEALGHLGTPHEPGPAVQGAPVPTLLQILRSDPSTTARIQAAESLGRLDAPETVPGLRSALDSESDAQVVDAIILALKQRGAPIRDPQECGQLVHRTWDANVAKPLFDCWRASASYQQVLHAALAGPPVERAVALDSLAPAEHLAPIARQIFRVPEPPAARLDPALQHRLLNSAVDVLSQEKQISYTTRYMTQGALWRISGKNMALALRYTDRITPALASFYASYTLANVDATAYDAYRRPRQFGSALLVGLVFALFVFYSPVRRAAILLAASTVAWGLWSLQASGVRELPPPPLRLLGAAAIGFLCAGAVAAAVTSVFWRRASAGRALAVLRGASAVVAAGVVAFVVCGMTRSTRLFPVGSEGWELIFDPVESLVLAVFAAAVLAVMDALILWVSTRWRLAMVR